MPQVHPDPPVKPLSGSNIGCRINEVSSSKLNIMDNTDKKNAQSATTIIKQKKNPLFVLALLIMTSILLYSAVEQRKSIATLNNKIESLDALYEKVDSINVKQEQRFNKIDSLFAVADTKVSIITSKINIIKRDVQQTAQQ